MSLQKQEAVESLFSYMRAFSCWLKSSLSLLILLWRLSGLVMQAVMLAPLLAMMRLMDLKYSIMC